MKLKSQVSVHWRCTLVHRGKKSCEYFWRAREQEQGLFHSFWSPQADSWSQQKKDWATQNKGTTELMPNAGKARRRAYSDHPHCSSCAYFLWYKSLLELAAPEGKALFFTSASELGILFHFSRWPQQQQTKLIPLPLTRPVTLSI